MPQYENLMPENGGKPWYLSRSIWSSLIVVFVSAVRLITGNVVGTEDTQFLSNNLYEIIVLIFGIGAWFYRWRATTKISNRPL